jgi:parallel beta-helix repeat protein
MVIVSENVINEPAGYGIDAAYATNFNLAITTNTIFLPGTFGISLDGYASTVKGNIIYQPGEQGIKVTSRSEYCSVEGNIVYQPTGNGIDLLGTPEYISVCDNVMYYPAAEGIVARGYYHDISDNTVAYGDFGGILLVGASNCSVDGNISRDNYGGYGLSFDATSNNNVVDDNILDSNDSGPIENLGTDNKINGKVENNSATTDATVTTISTVAIADDTVVWVEADVIARGTSAAQRAKYKVGALVYREAAGGATIQGALWTPVTIESDVSWDCTITVAGNNALIQVTGEATTDVNWKSRHTLVEQT